MGEVVRGRCRAANLCGYCARLAAVETSEMLALDAMYGVAPRLWMVLTTRTATIDTAAFYNARRLVVRALKRRWPALEVAWLLEFTTGFGKRSGGRRRPHWNAMLKGVDPEDLADVAEVVKRVWCAHVDALPQGQHVQEITAAGGLMKYLALHFQKQSQAPPEGWSGHRFTATRGYLWLPTPQARDAARRSLRAGRARRAARQAGWTDPADIEIAAAEAMAIADATDWELVQLLPQMAARSAPTGALAPLGALGLGPQGPALKSAAQAADRALRSSVGNT